VGGALKSSALYAVKLIVFSIIAAVPVLLLGSRLNAAFAGRGRIVSQGLPFAISAVLFGVVGLGLLFVSRDKQFRVVLNLLRGKKSGGKIDTNSPAN
jgi:putative peptidoglycan lipid II flippase